MRGNPEQRRSTMTESRITDIRIVAVPVVDQDRAVEFYVGKLGFEKRMDTPLPQLGGRWIVVAPARATTAIALVPARDDAPAGVDTGIRLASGDAAATHKDLSDLGVAVDELLSWPGVPPMFALRDADGNHLFVVEE
jgi:catechol 2,3-dioxygenase-like lactoylglutathione lyase family enzyme